MSGNAIDLTDKAIVDDWMLEPEQSLVKLIQKHIPKASKHLGACSKRFNRIMRKPEVEAYVANQIQMLQQHVDIDQVDATRFLANTLNNNVADFIEFNDANILQIKDLTEMPRDLTAQVKKIKIKTSTTIFKDGTEQTNSTTEFELYDKMAAIDRLAKLLKWWEDNGKGNSLIGVIVVPEGSTKEKQWSEYVQLPEGGQLIPSSK